MQKKIIILLLLLLLFSCNSFIEDSKGAFNQIIIVSSNEDRLILEPIIDEYIFIDTIYTPEPETKYKKLWIEPHNFKYFQDYSNIFIISLDDPIDKSLDPIINDFKDKNKIEKFPIITRNIHSNPQIITFIQSLNSLELKSSLDEIGVTINALVNKHADSLYFYRYNKFDKNKKISNLSSEIFNYELSVDKNFKIIDYNNSDKFLWIGKGDVGISNSNYKWLIIKENNKVKLNGNIELLELINKNLNQINSHIKIISNNNQYYINQYKDFNLYKVYTNYNHSLYNAGGFLVVYLLEDLLNDKNTLFYGFVNAPGQSKMKHIKELETIIINSIF